MGRHPPWSSLIDGNNRLWTFNIHTPERLHTPVISQGFAFTKQGEKTLPYPSIPLPGDFDHAVKASRLDPGNIALGIVLEDLFFLITAIGKGLGEVLCDRNRQVRNETVAIMCFTFIQGIFPGINGQT